MLVVAQASKAERDAFAAAFSKNLYGHDNETRLVFMACKLVGADNRSFTDDEIVEKVNDLVERGVVVAVEVQ
jgi:hypothetical protein